MADERTASFRSYIKQWRIVADERDSAIERVAASEARERAMYEALKVALTGCPGEPGCGIPWHKTASAALAAYEAAHPGK